MVPGSSSLDQFVLGKTLKISSILQCQSSERTCLQHVKNAVVVIGLPYIVANNTAHVAMYRAIAAAVYCYQYVIIQNALCTINTTMTYLIPLLVDPH